MMKTKAPMNNKNNDLHSLLKGVLLSVDFTGEMGSLYSRQIMLRHLEALAAIHKSISVPKKKNSDQVSIAQDWNRVGSYIESAINKVTCNG